MQNIHAARAEQAGVASREQHRTLIRMDRHCAPDQQPRGNIRPKRANV